MAKYHTTAAKRRAKAKRPKFKARKAEKLTLIKQSMDLTETLPTLSRVWSHLTTPDSLSVEDLISPSMYYGAQKKIKTTAFASLPFDALVLLSNNIIIPADAFAFAKAVFPVLELHMYTNYVTMMLRGLKYLFNQDNLIFLPIIKQFLAPRGANPPFHSPYWYTSDWMWTLPGSEIPKILCLATIDMRTAETKAAKPAHAGEKWGNSLLKRIDQLWRAHMIWEHGGCCTDTVIFTCLYGSAHGHKKCDLKACYESYDCVGDYVWLPLNLDYDHLRTADPWPGKITEAILMGMDEFIELFKTYSLWRIGGAGETDRFFGYVAESNRVISYDVGKEINIAWYFNKGALCMKELLAGRDARIDQIRKESKKNEETQESDDEYMNEELAQLCANRPRDKHVWRGEWKNGHRIVM